MHRTAVFVDAGYLYAQAAVCLTGGKTNRSRLKLDEAELVNQLKSKASETSAGIPLLRIYWYDGAKNGMTVEQSILAEMADVKVRLGSINSAGQQKGVDSLLVTDLIDLARNQAISDAVVVTGDGDMRIALQIAQSFGVRVHLIGLEPSKASQSSMLRQEADTVHEFSRDSVAKFMRHITPSASEPKVSSVPEIVSSTEEFDFDAAVSKSLHSHISQLDPTEVAELRQVTTSTKRIPEQYDRGILGTCGALLKRELTDPERRLMRKKAIEYIDSIDDEPRPKRN